MKLPRTNLRVRPQRRPRDTTSLDAVWAENARGVGLVLIQLLGDRPTAEDVLQETWIVAHKTGLAGVDHPRAWLYTVARRIALNRLRSDRRRRYYEHQAARPEATGESQVDAISIATTLHETLDPDDRLLVLLRYRQGFDATELAEVFDITPDALRKRLSRATIRLAEAIRNADAQKDEGP